MSKDNINLGEEIRKLVENSIEQMDFKDLNKKINDTVNGAVYEVKSAIKTGGVTIKRQIDNITNVKPERREIRIPYQEKGRISGMVSAVLGGVGSFVFGIAMTVFLILSLTLPSVPVFPILLVTFSPFLIGSIFLLGNGISLRNQAKRSRRYLAFLKEKGYCSIESMAARIGMSEKKVRQDVKKMLTRGIFPQGSLDEQETCLIGNQEYYEQYQNALNSYRERMALEQKEAEKVEESVYADNTNSQVEETLQEGKRYLAEISQVQQNIYEPEFSGKLQRLHTVIEQIFEHVKKYPDQLDEIRKFMEYYLPTTLKLVKAYENFSRQPIQGENIVQAKKEIEDTIETINTAFEQLLDSLYEDVTMDVSTDISVLHTMLAQEGLTEKDFK